LFNSTIITYSTGVVICEQHNFVELFYYKSVYNVMYHKAREAGWPTPSAKRKVDKIYDFLNY